MGTVLEYFRQQAIADGMLVDVTEMAGEAGFRCSVAMTQRAWNCCVAVTTPTHGEDEEDRLWNVLFTMRCAIEANRKRTQLTWKVAVKDCERERSQTVTLKGVMGPGDAREPTLTVMLPDED